MTVTNNLQHQPQTSAYTPFQRSDLRQAFIHGAATMMRERGEDRFSLNELARNLGVSPAAAYRHFSNKDALLAAVCDSSFRQLGEVLQEPLSESTSRGDAVIELGIRYVQFAVDNSDVFAMMFGRRSASPETVGKDTFLPLVQAVTLAQKEGLLPPAHPMKVAGAIWVTVHGIALLHLNGGLATLGLDGGPRDLVTGTLSLQFPSLTSTAR